MSNCVISFANRFRRLPAHCRPARAVLSAALMMRSRSSASLPSISLRRSVCGRIETNCCTQAQRGEKSAPGWYDVAVSYSLTGTPRRTLPGGFTARQSCAYDVDRRFIMVHHHPVGRLQARCAGRSRWHRGTGSLLFGALRSYRSRIWGSFCPQAYPRTRNHSPDTSHSHRTFYSFCWFFPAAWLRTWGRVHRCR